MGDLMVCGVYGDMGLISYGAMFTWGYVYMGRSVAKQPICPFFITLHSTKKWSKIFLNFFLLLHIPPTPFLMSFMFAFFLTLANFLCVRLC
jgi:F0F1-type ATP synthase membrane subunit c/vacuolar-type H+-ATPase subunit K